jgi:hypothetical protein
MNIHIKNGRLIDPKNNIDMVCDVYTAAGKIAATGKAPNGFVTGKSSDDLLLPYFLGVLPEEGYVKFKSVFGTTIPRQPTKASII